MRGKATQRLTDSRLYRLSSRRAYHLCLRATQAVHDLGALLRAPTPDRHDPYRVLRLDPRLVAHLLGTRLPQRVAGRSLGGDWDADVLPLCATALHRGLHQRFAEGRDWAETDLHPARYTRGCPNEPPQYEVYSEEQFLRRGSDLDRLYEQLARRGYLDHRARGEPAGTEMAIAVTSAGLFARQSGGLHRLIMAQLLGLRHVPVRVFVVHADRTGTAHDPFAHERAAPRGAHAARRIR